MANLNKMTKAALQDELLATHGEKAPSKWTKLELKARINELRGEEEVLPKSGSTLHEGPSEGSQEKERVDRVLPQHPGGSQRERDDGSDGKPRPTTSPGDVRGQPAGLCRVRQVLASSVHQHPDELRGVQSVDQTDVQGGPRGDQHRPQAAPTSAVVAGQRGKKTEYPNKKEPGQRKKGTLGEAFATPAHEPGQSSTSLAPMGTPKDPRLETVIQEQNKRMDQMANVIELLRSELTASRGERPRKGAERKIENDDQQEEDAYMTEGSYSMVSTAGTQKSVGK
eukprot:s516_g3.t1